jgi:hypothetical protein
MGARAPGMMTGEDLSVLFEGQPTAQERPHFTACYADYVLAGNHEWFLIADSEGRRKRLYNRRKDPCENVDVSAENPEIVDQLWRVLEDEAGGTLPQFGSKGVLGG